MRLRLTTALRAAGLAGASPGCRETSRPEPPPASATGADAGSTRPGGPGRDAETLPDVAAAAPRPEPSGTLRLSYDAARDRLDLVARDVPLARILAELVAQTGVALDDRSGRDHAERSSFRLEGVTLADGAEQLLQGRAKVFRYAPGEPPRLARILLLPLRSDRVAGVVAAVRRGDERLASKLAAALAEPERSEERALAVDELADALAEEPLELRTHAVRDAAATSLNRLRAEREATAGAGGTG